MRSMWQYEIHGSFETTFEGTPSYFEQLEKLCDGYHWKSQSQEVNSNTNQMDTGMEEMNRCAKEVRVYQTICNIDNKAQKELGKGLMLLVDISIPCVYK